MIQGTSSAGISTTAAIMNGTDTPSACASRRIWKMQHCMLMSANSDAAQPNLHAPPRSYVLSFVHRSSSTDVGLQIIKSPTLRQHPLPVPTPLFYRIACRHEKQRPAHLAASGDPPNTHRWRCRQFSADLWTVDFVVPYTLRRTPITSHPRSSRSELL